MSDGPSSTSACVPKLDEDNLDRVETALSQTLPREETGLVETSFTSPVAVDSDEAHSGRSGFQDRLEEDMEHSETAEACVSSGQSVQPSTGDTLLSVTSSALSAETADVVTESRQSAESADVVTESRQSPVESKSDSVDLVSSVMEVQPLDRVGCSTSALESTPAVAASQLASEMKDCSSALGLKDLDNFESSSSSALCRGHGDDVETLRTDVLMESPKICESLGEERSSGQISSSQGFVPSSDWEEPHTLSQGIISTGRPMKDDAPETESSVGPNISSSGDVAETNVGSSLSGALDAADCVQNRTGSCREVNVVGEGSSIRAQGSQGVVPSEASSSGKAGGSAPQECRVSSCSQDQSVEGEAGISSSQGQPSPGQEGGDGECDSSVPGVGVALQDAGSLTEQSQAWGEECRVDSTTQSGDRSSVDPAFSDLSYGSNRTARRQSGWEPGEAQSLVPSQSSGDARSGSEPEASSSQADSASLQRTAKKKVSFCPSL